MIKFLFILLLPFALNASKILSYNIYDRTDRVDVMITFDTPYNGVIKQSNSSNKIIVKLEDTLIDSPKLKRLKSKFLNAISISPMAGYSQIVATTPPSIQLKASKTSDSYGLRLRFTTDILKANKQDTIVTKANPLALLPTKANDDMSQSYYIVVSILIIGIILLFIIRRKIPKTHEQKTIHLNGIKEIEPAQHSDKNNNVSIRFQKSIDSENSVVMLDFGSVSYLVLMGKSNILLDKLTNDVPTNQNDFETILQNRHKELDDFLNIDSESNEALDAYKEKAATISYKS